MLKLREEFLAIEEDSSAGRMGVSLDEFESYWDSIISEVKNGLSDNFPCAGVNN